MDNQFFVEYVNKKNKTVKVEISRHAIFRFMDRWNVLHPNKQIDAKESLNHIIEKFPKQNRISNLKNQDKKRMARYGNGKDTIYFRNGDFTYVVCNGVLVTIEISDDDYRNLNKKFTLKDKLDFLEGVNNENKNC